MNNETNINVIPENDLRPHLLGVDCHCNPRVIKEGASQIIVHNAYDGREIVEELLQNKKPN